MEIVWGWIREWWWVWVGLAPLAVLPALGSVAGGFVLLLAPFVIAGAAVVLMPLAYWVNCRVDDQTGQPWALVSFMWCSASSAAGLWFMFVIAAHQTKG